MNNYIELASIIFCCIGFAAGCAVSWWVLNQHFAAFCARECPCRDCADCPHNDCHPPENED